MFFYRRRKRSNKPECVTVCMCVCVYCVKIHTCVLRPPCVFAQTLEREFLCCVSVFLISSVKRLGPKKSSIIRRLEIRSRWVGGWVGVRDGVERLGLLRPPFHPPLPHLFSGPPPAPLSPPLSSCMGSIQVLALHPLFCSPFLRLAARSQSATRDKRRPSPP